MNGSVEDYNPGLWLSLMPNESEITIWTSLFSSHLRSGKPYRTKLDEFWEISKDNIFSQYNGERGGLKAKLVKDYLKLSVNPGGDLNFFFTGGN